MLAFGAAVTALEALEKIVMNIFPLTLGISIGKIFKTILYDGTIMSESFKEDCRGCGLATGDDWDDGSR